MMIGGGGGVDAEPRWQRRAGLEEGHQRLGVSQKGESEGEGSSSSRSSSSSSSSNGNYGH